MTLGAPEAEGLQETARITPEQLLRRRAQRTPEGLAILDPPNRHPLSPSAQRKFTYAEANTAVDALASHIVDLGLGAGDLVVAQLPNFSEMPLTLLGAWRAGLTIAAIPMLWRATELARVCDALEPAALIGISRYGDDNPAELLRDVASTRLSVRFVLGFGPDLPGGVSSLDEAILDGPMPGFIPRSKAGVSLITFTARAGAPLVPIFRQGDDILLQGAMTMLSLALDRQDILVNAYPMTGPVGIAAGLAPWLIGGTALVQHDPFDYPVLVDQILSTGATAIALPGTVLDELGRDGILRDPKCKLRRIARVWSPCKLAGNATSVPADDGASFDFCPLGDLATVVLRTGPDRGTLPLGPIHISEGESGTHFIETAISAEVGIGPRDIAVRGAIVPYGRAMGPAARDSEGFIKTGLLGTLHGERLHVVRNPELIYHGGFTIAASELDGLYQAFPSFLDAACFVLPDPVVGDRIFAAVVPEPSAPISIDALRRFLTDRGVAPYKFPDKLLVVRELPRGADGIVARDTILDQL